MMIWIYCALLAILAALFVLWRTRFPGRTESSPAMTDLAFNRTLFQEKSLQLEMQRERGEISPQQFEELQLEHQRQFIADNPVQEVFSSQEAVSIQEIASLEKVASIEQAAPIQTRGRWLVIAIALAVPVLAAVLYLQLGALDQLRLRQLLETRSTLVMEGEVESGRVKSLTGNIQDSLATLSVRYPEDPLYPVLLARLYMDEGAHSKALVQYRKVIDLLPEDGELRAEYAQVLFFAAGNRVTGEMIREAEAALALFPNSQTALGLMGISSFHGGQFQQAIDYWSRALGLLPATSPSRAALESGIAAARERLGEKSGKEEIVNGNGLIVEVSLADDIPAPKDATVFVYARTWQGSPMPLAIRRMTVGDLPAQVVLDDTMAMNPAMNLSSADQVEVVARVSLTGEAAPASGDILGTFGPVKTRGKENYLKLVINSRVP